MMRLLLDTHTFLWFVTNDPLLSNPASALIADPTNGILISPASYWEVAIKVSIGKYPMAVSLAQFFTEAIDGNDFTILHLDVKHAEILAGLPMHHKDPFDRMLISQAIGEAIPIVSVDAKFDLYGVARIW